MSHESFANVFKVVNTAVVNFVEKWAGKHV